MVKPLIGITVDLSFGRLRRLTLKNDYADAVSRAGGLPVLIPPVAGDASRFAQIIDGLLIPGGDDLPPSYYGEEPISGLKVVAAERSDFEISLFREIIGLGKPVLGICYGMQLVNIVLGGSLYQDINKFIFGALDHRRGHNVSIRGDGPLPGGTYRVASFHHQAVRKLGNGLNVLATSDDGLIEAVYMSGYPFLLCVQWHPERGAPSHGAPSHGHGEGGLSDIIFGRFIDSAHPAARTGVNN